MKPPASWKLALPDPFANQNGHCTNCVNPMKLQVPRERPVNLLAAFWERDSPIFRRAGERAEITGKDW